MWRVSALDRDGREIAHCELVDGEVSIGRDNASQLMLPSASVSRRHCKLVVEAGRPCIVDEGSANGVQVNGVRITAPTAVGPSTRIEVAEFRIAIEALAASENALPPPIVASNGQSPAPAAGGVRLVAEGGPYDGRVFNLPPGSLSVGRAVENDLVFDDPSLSRHHAKIHRQGPTLEVEDLGSSNGTYVNGRRVGRGLLQAGDVLRFGDLSFRCEGGEYGSTRSVDPGLDKLQFYGLVGGGALTFLLLVLAMVFLIRKVPPVQASGRDAIARLEKQAGAHLQQGRKLYSERRFSEAKGELEQAVELDPANVEGRRLQKLAARGPDDERALSSAQAALAIGDKKGLNEALRLFDEMPEGALPRTTLQGKLGAALERYGDNACGRRDFGDCAWALCRAFAVAPAGARPSASEAQKLREAEKKLRHAPPPCRALSQ